MLLIFPPIAKPCEPPAGVALLSAALKENGFSCKVLDANIQGILHLIHQDIEAKDSWSKRAVKNREAILSDLKNIQLYTHMDRYHQRVYDLNRLLSLSVDRQRFRISLNDYSDALLSSVDSKDLLKSAAHYQENPFYGFFEACLKPEVLASESPWIGISLCYLNQALIGFALAGWIKDTFKDKKIIMGGGLISSWMSRPDYTHPFDGLVDVCIRGEGEQPLLNLLGQKRVTKKHYIPDYDFVKKDVYLAPGKVLPFRASIGCYWKKCRFCPEKAETRPYSSKRAPMVLEDLKIVESRYCPDYVHFTDNAVTPAFLKALSHETFSFKWYGFVRFEKEFLDLNFCLNLKQSGCDMLKLGLESGDQAVLDQMNKGTDLGRVSQILKNLHQAGILTFVYLLFGTSFEDRAAAFKTLDFVKAHESCIDYLNLAVFNLPRFSEDARGLDTRNFYQGDLSLYLNFTHPLGWDRKQVKQFIDKIFKKQVSVGSDSRKSPAFFSSNHAVFFNRLRKVKPVHRLGPDPAGEMDHPENRGEPEKGLTLAEQVGQLLARQKKTLAIAESCTGGLISSMVTDVAGSSDYFLFSGVTYSNDAKIHILDVSPKTLMDHGAVHEQTALEMAKGVRLKAGADFGISTTGIAGPGGGTVEKPVGMVCIGLAGEGFATAGTYRFFSKNRLMNKKRFAMAALALLRDHLTLQAKTS